MKKHFQLVFIFLCLVLYSKAQEISPLLFGQNHWMDQGDESDRPGYLQRLWPKVEEGGIKLVRIGGNGYEHHFPSRQKLTAMIDSIQGIGAEPILQVPSHFSSEEVRELVTYFNNNPERKPVIYWSIGNEPLLRVRHDSGLAGKGQSLR